MPVIRRVVILIAAAALGAGAAIGVSACGEDRGEVRFEDGTGTAGTGTAGTETAGTETVETGTETSETGTEDSDTETTP
jgi:hypothetical protein